MVDAEAAWKGWRADHPSGIYNVPYIAFTAGHTSRDAEVAALEARVVELEAVIQKVRETLTTYRVVMVRRERGYTVEEYSNPLVPVKAVEEVLDSSPSVVLADRDAAVWDQGYDRGFYDRELLTGESRDASEGASDNPYRGDNR